MKLAHFLRIFFLCLIALMPARRLHAQYCTPAFSFGCTFASIVDGDDINTFTLTGASSTSISNLNTGCSGGYDDRTSESITFFQGAAYSGTINVSSSLSGGDDGMQVYIDFNNNFVFDVSESVGGVNIIATAPGTTMFSINIPAGAAIGAHRMRVVLCSDADATYPGIDPCGTSIIAPPPFPSFPYSYGEVHDYTANITTASIPCAPVTGLAASAITSSGATISWTAVTGATGYEWAVNTSPTPPASGTATTLTSANPTGLTASTLYYAHVRTNCGSSFSTWTTISFTTSGATTTCAPVTGLTMSSITTTGATLNWTAVTGATGYQWAVNTSATAPASGTATTLTTASATGLTAATAYYAHVRTVCGATFSTWVSVPFSTLSTSCPAITGLAASAITGTSATVSWTAVTSGSLGYQYVINNTVTDPTGSGTNTTSASTSPTGLTAGTTYYAHVRDSCGVGSFSAWGTIPFTTLSTICNAVTGLSVSAITSSGATLNWTMASGAVAAKYVVDLLPADPAVSGTTSTTSTAVITSLSASTTYYAHVRDSCGPAALSAWVTVPFTTLAGTGNVAVLNGNAFSLSVYPNPVKDVLTVQANGNMSGEGRVVVYDITGKELIAVSMDGQSLLVDMAGLPQGMYLVRYVDSERTITTRVSRQ